MKKISLIIAVFAAVIWAREYGVKLAGSGACVRACGAPVLALSLVPEYQRLTESKLTGSNYYCAVNLVGSKCLQSMRERRLKDTKAVKISRNRSKRYENEFIAIDYLGCIYGQYNPKIEPCLYKE